MEQQESTGEEVKKTSHEPLFGVLVMVIILVFVVVLASYGGWFLYHGIKNSRNDAARLSIEDIPMAKSEETQNNAQEESKPMENNVVSPENPVINKKIAIKVLNGGAVKGSAGIVADLLKGDGYTTISTGNSTGDYSGVSVYFKAPATEADANAARETLLKKYPGAVVKPSVTGTADTVVSPVTVIVGKE